MACGDGEHADDDNAGEEPGIAVAALEVQQRDLSRQLSTSATVEPWVRVRLAARRSGIIDAVHVEEGDAVSAGEVLAELDTAEEQAQLRRARSIEEQAEEDYRRNSDLREDQLLSRAEYEQSRLALVVARSERQLWETRVSFGVVKAPRDAVVSARYAEVGEAVAAEETLFELVTSHQLVLRMGVSELDVTHLQVGQEVPLQLDAVADYQGGGSIRRIFPQADRQSRLVTVEVSLAEDASAQGVRPGYLARVDMAIDQREDVIALPSAAMAEDDGEWYVMVIADDRLQRRVIERGATRGEWSEVVSGLEVGEVVLAANPRDMRDGQRVRIVGWRG